MSAPVFAPISTSRKTIPGQKISHHHPFTASEFLIPLRQNIQPLQSVHAPLSPFARFGHFLLVHSMPILGWLWTRHSASKEILCVAVKFLSTYIQLIQGSTENQRHTHYQIKTSAQIPNSTWTEMDAQDIEIDKPLTHISQKMKMRDVYPTLIIIQLNHNTWNQRHYSSNRRPSPSSVMGSFLK
jgi:hypothetical protein